MTYGAQLAALREALSGEGVAEARLEAELLLSHAAGIARPQLLARLTQPLDAQAMQASQELVYRRLRREPLFYILRRREFYGREFSVAPSVLIPRPETETLVEEALREVDTLSRRLGRNPVVVDVGTGSGAIAISLALEVPSLKVVGTDWSAEALEIARMNAERLGAADRVSFARADLLGCLQLRPDLIVSNPPYVPTGEIDDLAPEIALYEPRLALDGGRDGLDVVRRLLQEASDRLSAGGSLLMEIGDGQGTSVSRLAAAQFPNAIVDIVPDLAGGPRVARVITYV